MAEYEIFDDDGYPTEGFLQSIVDWPWQDGFEELLDHAMVGHIYPEYWGKEKKDGKVVWHISTGGWSGNESIMTALRENYIFWMVCWVQSRRGGHYIFETKESAHG